MDERTERLRDVFTSVTGEEEATERQHEPRGSLLDRSGGREAVLDVVGRMRERYGFSTDLDDGALATVVAGVYDGRSDADVAGELGVDPETVFRARTDLHLYREADFRVGDPDRLRERLADGDGDPPSAEALAREFDADPAAVRRTARALRALARSRRVEDRYRAAFDDALADAAPTGRLTARAREHGLDGALADAEVDLPL